MNANEAHAICRIPYRNSAEADAALARAIHGPEQDYWVTVMRCERTPGW